MHGQELIDCLPEDSFFRRWLRVWPTAECPNSYLLFSAMCMFGGALGRSVWFPQEYRKLWPMLNLLLIGPSGIGKSTAIVDIGKRLVDYLPAEGRPQFIVGGASPEKLHADLVPQPHAILFASELANFFNRQKYMEGMIPYVTELLDYRAVEKRTKSFDILRINEPSVTVVGGSTVEWLQGQLPDSAVTGGFLARFLIVKEDYKRQKIANPDRHLTKQQKLQVEFDRAACFEEFFKLVATSAGPVEHYDYGVGDTFAKWYNSHQPPSGHLAPFAARAGEFVNRLSMLLALSSGRHHVMEPDLHAAISLYSYIETKLQEVVVPFSPQGRLLALVLDAVGQHGCTDVDIKRAMRNFLPAQDVDKFITSLLMSKDIRLVDGKFYKIRAGEKSTH